MSRHATWINGTKSWLCLLVSGKWNTTNTANAVTFKSLSYHHKCGVWWFPHFLCKPHARTCLKRSAIISRVAGNACVHENGRVVKLLMSRAFTFDFVVAPAGISQTMIMRGVNCRICSSIAFRLGYIYFHKNTVVTMKTIMRETIKAESTRAISFSKRWWVSWKSRTDTLRVT